MNTAQRWISVVAVVAIVVATLFPPYCSSGEKPQRFGYHFIGCPPQPVYEPPPGPAPTALLPTDLLGSDKLQAKANGEGTGGDKVEKTCCFVLNRSFGSARVAGEKR
jgi:hypothetical protein